LALRPAIHYLRFVRFAAPIACLAVAGLAACGSPDASTSGELVSGFATRYGRLEHGGIRVRVEPDGPETFTDDDGGWVLPRVPIRGATLSFEAPGFAAEHLELWTPGEQSPVMLYRGRAVPLDVDWLDAVVDAEPLPPAGLLLTGPTGDRVLVDLAAGRVSLALPADWHATDSTEGYVIGIDALSGDVTGTTMDGRAVQGPAGFSPEGTLTLAGGERQGLVLTRPRAAAGPLREVVFWEPGAEPIAFPEPVRAVGPTLRLDDDTDAVTLLLSDGWVHWRPGTAPARLRMLTEAVAATASALHPRAGSGSVLCYTWGPLEARALDCVGPRLPGRTLTTLPLVGGRVVEPVLAAADPAFLVWSSPGPAGPDACTAMLASGETPSAPFRCRADRLTGHALGDGVVFRDADGRLHRLGPAGHEDIGPGGPLTSAGNGQVLGFLSEDRWLTVLGAGGLRRRASTPCSPGSALYGAGDAMLAIDAEGAQALLVAPTGPEHRVPLLSADVRAAATPSAVSRAGDRVSLAGPSGFVRLDVVSGEVFTVVHRGWHFVDFAWPLGASPAETLPELGLVRARDRIRAVDLYSLNTEALGEGRFAGLLNGRAWFVGPRGLFVVDDPAAR
jgi:hypothetical protein